LPLAHRPRYLLSFRQGQQIGTTIMPPATALPMSQHPGCSHGLLWCRGTRPPLRGHCRGEQRRGKQLTTLTHCPQGMDITKQQHTSLGAGTTLPGTSLHSNTLSTGRGVCPTPHSICWHLLCCNDMAIWRTPLRANKSMQSTCPLMQYFGCCTWPPWCMWRHMLSP
jgi:hypothetical protein